VGKRALAITKIDEKGRITFPKVIRKKGGIKPGTYVSVKSKDNLIIIEPSESIAEKYSGIFQISKWPKDLDEFFAAATEKWWIQQGARFVDLFSDPKTAKRRLKSWISGNSIIKILFIWLWQRVGAREIVSNDKDFDKTEMKRTI